MKKQIKLLANTRLSLWLFLCVLALTATSVYAADNERPLAAVDILGSPDAAVTGKLAVGTATPGNKALTVAGALDWVGAGTVHSYFTQGPGDNMQIRTNVDEYNSVVDATKSQWNMVMGSSLDVFSIRRSPAGAIYNEDALFWIEGDTGRVGIATVDTSNGATIPFVTYARLHVETDSGEAIRGRSNDTSSAAYGVHGISYSTQGVGVYGESNATSGDTIGVHGQSTSPDGRGVDGYASSSTGATSGVYGRSRSPSGFGVYGWNSATSGNAFGVYGYNASPTGRAVYGLAAATSGANFGVYGTSSSTDGKGVVGITTATTGSTYAVYGESASTDGMGVRGEATASSGATAGVYGLSESTNGYGVIGWANTTTGSNMGVWGQSESPDGRAVYGNGAATSGDAVGVYGRSGSDTGRGVYGHASTSSGANYGVYGESHSTAGTGVYAYANASSGTTYGVQAVSDSSAGYDFYAAGTGTDYGPFTGAHEVLLSDSFPLHVQAGLIVSAVGEAHVRKVDDGDVDLSSTLPTVMLADSVEDKAVFGVIVAEVTLPEGHWYTAEEGERFASVNALGEGRVWVSSINGDIEAGDYITTSILPGYGQLQDSSQLNNYTLAKATETVDWDKVTDTITFSGQEYKVYLLAVVYTSG